MQNIYANYYWQNDKVRLRAMRPEDENHNNSHAKEDFDSEAWAMAHEEMTLPIAKREVKATDSEAVQNEKAPAFSIENLEGNIVGHIHFNYINERHGTFSIGLMLWRDYRKKGYGKAAMQILLEYAFNERRLNKFTADCIECNVASISLLKSLGCQQEGNIREEIFFNGSFHSRLVFGLTATEYNGSYERN